MNRFLSSINCLFEFMRVFNCNANVLLFSITTVLALVVLCLTTWWLQNCSRIKLCYFFGLSTLYESLRLILFGLKLVTDKTNFDLAVMSLCRKCTVRITRHHTYIYIYTWLAEKFATGKRKNAFLSFFLSLTALASSPQSYSYLQLVISICFYVTK